MDLPSTVFVLALVPPSRPSDAPMVVYGVEGADGRRTPVFSSINTAADFLTRAQQLGHTVRFDYLFRADAARLASDFPNDRPVLDPTAEDIFGGPPAVDQP